MKNGALWHMKFRQMISYPIIEKLNHREVIYFYYHLNLFVYVKSPVAY